MNKKRIAKLVFRFLNWLPLVNKFSTHGCSVSLKESILMNCSIKSVGVNNSIAICGALLENTNIIIRGNNNRVVANAGVRAKKAEIYIEDDGNEVIVGEKTNFAGKIHLACTEGTKIVIGKECLFSSDVVFRTGDSHSILDMEGRRINSAKDIHIGDRVWIGHRALINKGVTLSNDSVVGTGSVVTKKFDESNVIIAGVPAVIVKRSIMWDSKRI